MNMLAKAIHIASEAHLNQTDKGGKPYILHPLWVCVNPLKYVGLYKLVISEIIRGQRLGDKHPLNEIFG